jgi:hypothetical protein
MRHQYSTSDRERLVTAIADRGDTRAQRALGCVQILNRTASQLASLPAAAAAVDTQSVFWIRLHGVLTEVGDSYEHMCNLGSRDRDVLAVRDAIRDLRGSLDEDELLWVHYRRDTECHVWQESYELQGAKGRLKDERKFALLGGKTLQVDEIDRRLRAMVRKYNVDEPAIAVAFATKLQPRIAAVLSAMLPLYVS